MCRQYSKIIEPDLALTRHLLQQAGADDASIDFARIHGLDDPGHRQADKKDFLEIGFRINALAEHLPGRHQIATKGFRCDGCDAFPSQVSEFTKRGLVGSGQNHRAKRPRRIAILGIQCGDPADPEFSFHGDVIPGIGNDQINTVPGDGLAQAGCIIVVESKMMRRQRLIQIADHR